jgi:hypothetical protein
VTEGVHKANSFNKRKILEILAKQDSHTSLLRGSPEHSVPDQHLKSTQAVDSVEK